MRKPPVTGQSAVESSKTASMIPRPTFETSQPSSTTAVIIAMESDGSTILDRDRKDILSG